MLDFATFMVRAMGVHLLWLANAVIRTVLVLAFALLLGFCLAAPYSAAGAALHEAMTWVRRDANELVTTLDPIGTRTLAGGATVFCLVGTDDCEQEPIIWPSLSLPRLLPPQLQPGRAWLAAGIAVATLIAFRRRHAR